MFLDFFHYILKTTLSFCPCLCFHPLFASLLKTPVCQASKPGWGLVLARQWAMQAFFSPQWACEWSLCPHMRSVGPALPTLLIAGDVLDSVQLTSKGTEIHHCPKRNLWRADRGSTCVKKSDFVQPPKPSTNFHRLLVILR